MENTLSDADVLTLREKHGWNELAETVPVSGIRKFLRHFNEPVVWLLLAAGAIAASLSDVTDALVIFAIVLLNAILGFIQEERAGKAIAALRKLSQPVASVYRGGEWRKLPARELVPGDRVELGEGDIVPADLRLGEAHELNVDESMLTGESLPVEKSSHAAGDAKPANKVLAFHGTHVHSGVGKGTVVATGMATELGKIAYLVDKERGGPTPLQKKIATFGKTLTFVCLGLIAVVFCVHLLRGGDLFEVFFLAVSLAVAAVPESLPAVVTIALALGMGRLAKKKALVRNLGSVETLGSVSIICSDKTGTLTYNRLTVRKIFPDLRAARAVAASLYTSTARYSPEGGSSGDPTELALFACAHEKGLDLTTAPGELLRVLPFSSRRRFTQRIYQLRDGSFVAYAKGAPEVILPRCAAEVSDDGIVAIDDGGRRKLASESEAMGKDALRVLAVAEARFSKMPEGDSFPLAFVGLIGMMDIPSTEAKEGIEKCRSAGIRPIMITGDSAATAFAVARELGIASDRSQVLTGQKLEELDDEGLARISSTTSVFARVSPEHKLRIVKALKRGEVVVAMTGDGVNDAPALKAADIGISMGRGTEVTKHAADLVLTDDNFRTIVNAVEEGRGILDNIQKVIHYLLAGNTGEILVMFVGAVLGWPYPLLATQILWINLVTDGLPALGLVAEPIEPGTMRRPPRAASEPILSGRLGLVILAEGILIAASVLAAFHLTYHGHAADLPRARAVAFCTLALTHLFFVLTCRSPRRSLWRLGLFSNSRLLALVGISIGFQLGIMLVSPFREIFRIAYPLSGPEWVRILIFSLAPVILIELAKSLRTCRK